jgi:predicted HicB family RNase H-like nuclease
MTNTMTHKGYTARIEYDPRDEIFVGRVLGIEDRITFHGATVGTLRRDFRAAIDHYLVDCAARTRVPQKPYSGKILLRVAPDVHARAALTAQAQRVGTT